MQDPNPDVHACLARADLDAAPISEAERLLLRFVAKVTQHAYRTTDEEIAALRAAGWTEGQIAECIYDTALFAFFNRVADAFGLADPQYFRNPPPFDGASVKPAEESGHDPSGTAG